MKTLLDFVLMVIAAAMGAGVYAGCLELYLMALGV